jgi:hypothetical protein
MIALETWDKLEDAIGDAASMVELARESPDGPVDFARRMERMARA